MPDISYSQEIRRKLVHLSSLWMPALIFFVPNRLCAAIFGGVLIFNLLVEYGYHKKWPVVCKTYGRLFGKMLHTTETDTRFRPSGAPYVLAAALCCCLLFSRLNAVTALVVMLISDTAAALIGRAFGKHRINHNSKSIEGSVAFFLFGSAVICCAAALFGADEGFIVRGCIGVFIAMWAELYKNRLKIDDNLSVPLIIGVCLSL